MGLSTSMGEGDREMGEDARDGMGDGSGVIAWLYVLRAAICAEGRRSLDLPNRAGTRRIRVARRMAIGLSNSTALSSSVTASIGMFSVSSSVTASIWMFSVAVEF